MKRNFFFLKQEKDLLAFPFDKEQVCVLWKEENTTRNWTRSSINLPQFQKLQNSQKTAKHPVLKKEERVKNILISLLKEGKIDEEVYYSMIPRDSQPARLHGLPKVHKKKKKQSDWHCLSPGLHYHKVAVRFLGPFCELRVEQKLEEINKTAQELRVYPRNGSGSQSFISRHAINPRPRKPASYPLRCISNPLT